MRLEKHVMMQGNKVIYHRERRDRKPVYVRFNTNKIAKTEEAPGDAEVFMDFDSDGNLVGIEILSPFKIEDGRERKEKKGKKEKK